jgi:hypothetical protein
VQHREQGVRSASFRASPPTAGVGHERQATGDDAVTVVETVVADALEEAGLD